MSRRNSRVARPEPIANTSVGEFVILSVIVLGFLLAMVVIAYFV